MVVQAYLFLSDADNFRILELLKGKTLEEPSLGFSSGELDGYLEKMAVVAV